MVKDFAFIPKQTGTDLFFHPHFQYQFYNKRVAISVLIIWCVIEPIRLLYGFMGNLRENVSFCVLWLRFITQLDAIAHVFSSLQVADLATFLLITIFPQTPFVLYFAYIQPVIFPVDPIVGTLMLLSLVNFTKC